MTDLSTTDDFLGGDSSRFSGPFPLLTVLSGFCGSGPLLALDGLWSPPLSATGMDTLRRVAWSGRGEGGHARRKNDI